jgi:hypothetical protein
MHVFLGAFLMAFAPAIIAQLRGHSSALRIILLDVGSLVVLCIMGLAAMTHDSGFAAFIALAACGGWLFAFLWSLGK